MEITVIEDDYIRNIQSDFRKRYPHLKLEFYKNPHQVGASSPETEHLDATLPISEITMFHTGANVDVSPERTVAEVESDFFHKLGLCVQVMRQFGTSWVATTETDLWTLREQNDRGANYSDERTDNPPADHRIKKPDNK